VIGVPETLMSPFPARDGALMSLPEGRARVTGGIKGTDAAAGTCMAQLLSSPLLKIVHIRQRAG
jgi:hypothetical protein